MERVNCDVSPLKGEMKEQLTAIAGAIEQSILALENENGCLLGTFDQIRSRFSQLETTAASFYLQCYLGPYTDKYTDLSLAVQNLSSRKQGALIVVEREDSLQSYLQAGIPIGAWMTHSLLESIFFRAVPCMTGQLLSGKITSSQRQMSCPYRMCPLENKNWEQDIGRHWDSANNAMP